MRSQRIPPPPVRAPGDASAAGARRGGRARRCALGASAERPKKGGGDIVVETHQFTAQHSAHRNTHQPAKNKQLARVVVLATTMWDTSSAQLLRTVAAACGRGCVRRSCLGGSRVVVVRSGKLPRSAPPQSL